MYTSPAANMETLARGGHTGRRQGRQHEHREEHVRDAKNQPSRPQELDTVHRRQRNQILMGKLIKSYQQAGKLWSFIPSRNTDAAWNSLMPSTNGERHHPPKYKTNRTRDNGEIRHAIFRETPSAMQDEFQQSFLVQEPICAEDLPASHGPTSHLESRHGAGWESHQGNLTRQDQIINPRKAGLHAPRLQGDTVAPTTGPHPQPTR